MNAMKEPGFRKKTKSAVVLAVVCVMGIACLTGCGGKKNNATSKPSTSQSQKKDTASPSDKNQKPATNTPNSTAPINKPGITVKPNKNGSNKQEAPKPNTSSKPSSTPGSTSDQKQDTQKPTDNSAPAAPPSTSENSKPASGNSSSAKPAAKPGTQIVKPQQKPTSSKKQAIDSSLSFLSFYIAPPACHRRGTIPFLKRGILYDNKNHSDY